MVGKIRFSRWLVGAVILAVAECAGVARDRFALTRRRRRSAPTTAIRFCTASVQQRRLLRQDLFGRSSSGSVSEPRSEQPPQPVDHSRAPPPHKPDPNRAAPTTSIVVMGDGMADWLAYGLEDAFADSPEIAIVRKDKINSGLLRYEAKGDLDWWHVARDHSRAGEAQLRGHDARRQRPPEHPREAISPRRPTRTPKKSRTRKTPTRTQQTKEQADDQDQPGDRRARAATRKKRQRHHRIPQRQMGRGLLPSASTTRSPRSRARACRCSGSACRRSAAPNRPPTPVYLNDLYRARAERAGVELHRRVGRLRRRGRQVLDFRSRL